MSPDIVNDASRSFLDYGVVGALCLLLMVVIIYRERWWQTRFDQERISHDKTRDALLEEVRSNGDTIALVRTQMQKQQEAFDTLIRIRKEPA